MRQQHLAQVRHYYAYLLTYILTLGLGSQINNTVGLFPLPCHLCAITYLLFAKFIDFFMPGVRLIDSAVSFIRA